LKQRIALRCRLEPLSKEETQKYIAMRLWLAGASKRCHEIFPLATVELIHEYSRGIPRLINTLCEAALIATYAVKSGTVSTETIDEVASDFCLEVPSSASANRILHPKQVGASYQV
jgi:general secretion pathway protein A